MLVELVDKRLKEVLPKQDYLRLKSQAELAYAKIEDQAPESVLQNISDLLLTLNEVQVRLLENRFRDRYEAYAFVSKHPIG